MSVSQFPDLLGHTFTSVTSSSDRMEFHRSDGKVFAFFHLQDCCESVLIEDIAGDLSDLENSPLTMAEEVSNVDPEPKFADDYQPESFTWTFYKFATVKGYVTVRWLGESNGYYSESVTFEEVTP